MNYSSLILIAGTVSVFGLGFISGFMSRSRISSNRRRQFERTRGYVLEK